MDWKSKAVAATRGSKFGAIIACALGEEIEAPCFHGRASVTSDGFVMCDHTDRNGNGHMGAFVGSLDDVVRNIHGLVNHLKMSAEDRTAFVAVMRGWIVDDWSGRVSREVT